MSTHSFTLILDGATEITPELADALYGAGCDDATIASRDGVVFAEFDRNALSLAEAIGSATADVERAGVGLRVARVEPEGLASVAGIGGGFDRTS